MNRINLLPGAQRSAQLRRRRLGQAAVCGVVAGLVLAGTSWAALLQIGDHAEESTRESEQQLAAWRVQYQEALAIQEQVGQITQWRKRLTQWLAGRSQPHHWFAALEESWPVGVNLDALRVTSEQLWVEGQLHTESPRTALGEWVLSAGAAAVAAEVLEVHMAHDPPQTTALAPTTQRFRLRWVWPTASSAHVRTAGAALAPTGSAR